ncbi:hypothetical protein [Roseovarius confluentis]|uniref:hypothetical protein n=1 Tax=Roseovarius confluentis TaxID=1852027 RepID=UPI003BA841B4
MKVASLGIGLLATLGFSASAPEAKPVSIETFMDGIDGQEVFSAGQIGYFFGRSSAPYCHLEGGPYWVVDFALDRERLSLLEDCMISAEREGCSVTIHAETRMDGTEVELLIYEFSIQ